MGYVMAVALIFDYRHLLFKYLFVIYLMMLRISQTK
jgi:hypothetical protein